MAERDGGSGRASEARNQAEETLSESEERYRSLFQKNHAIMLLIDPDSGAIVDANPAASDYYGWAHEELLRKRIGEINTLTTEEIHAEMQLAREEKRNYFVFRHRRADGSIRDVEVYSSPVALMGKALLYSTVHDITERRKAEEALRESEEQFRLLFQHLPAGFALHEIICDTQGKPYDFRFLKVNPAYEELTGLKAADIIGKTVLQVLPGVEQDWIDRYGQVALGAGPVVFENSSASLAKSFQISAYSPMPKQFAAVVLDITDRKKLEEELRESESRFRAVFDQAAVGVALLNTITGEYVRVNQRYCGFLGYTMEEMLQKTLTEVTFPEDVRQNIEANAQLIDGSREALSYEKRYVRKDGSVVWGSLTISPLWKPDEKPTTYLHIAVVEDITERKRAEQALTISHAALLEAQAIGHIGSWSLDATTRMFAWSEEVYAIHGLQQGTNVSHESYLELIHPEDRKHVFEVMRSAMARKLQEFVVDYRIARPDGSERSISLSGKTALDGGNAVTGLRGTMQDITERKRAEAEKEAMQASLLKSKKLEAVGQLAGGVAHNFNNLLTGILGSIEIARMDTPPTSPAASSLDTAQTAALKAARLVRQLLAYGRNIVFLPTVQQASVTVESALDLICSSVPSSVEVMRELSPDAWDVLADSSRLTQVLLELINNAREAIENKGAITVRTGNVTVDEAYVATHPFARTGEFVVISVTDTGPGIEPVMMARLFEPFATTRQFGRGLGLPTVFGSIKQAGGWVDVQSEPGAGTTVGLYLPRHVEQV